MHTAEDEAAFDAFCRAQHAGLVGAVALVCGDRALAEELVQTALERAWVRWQAVQRMDSPGGWVRQVAFNLARSSLRRRAAERRANRRTGIAGPVQPEDSATVLTVRSALCDLPARQREALVHRYHGGLDTAQTAAAMGISAGAVKQLVHRGTSALRATIGPDDLMSAPLEEVGDA